MERLNDLQLFDDRPYLNRHFHLPDNVIPLPVPVVENTGHDNFADNLKCDVDDFPDRAETPDAAA